GPGSSTWMVEPAASATPGNHACVAPLPARVECSFMQVMGGLADEPSPPPCKKETLASFLSCRASGVDPLERGAAPAPVRCVALARWQVHSVSGRLTANVARSQGKPRCARLRASVPNGPLPPSLHRGVEASARLDDLAGPLERRGIDRSDRQRDVASLH